MHYDIEIETYFDLCEDSLKCDSLVFSIFLRYWRFKDVQQFVCRTEYFSKWYDSRFQDFVP